MEMRDRPLLIPDTRICVVCISIMTIMSPRFALCNHYYAQIQDRMHLCVCVCVCVCVSTRSPRQSQINLFFAPINKSSMTSVTKTVVVFMYFIPSG
jgi:hypothetical protein